MPLTPLTRGYPFRGGLLTLHEKKRFEARSLVLRDTELSFGARVLYYYLDDMAGERGSAYPRQQTITRAIGASLRQVRRFFQELEGRHIASTRKLGCASTRSLAWISGLAVRPSAASREAIGGLSKRPPATCDSLYEPDLIEPGGESPAAKCHTCGDSGLKGYPDLGNGPCDCAAGIAVRKRLDRPRKIDARRWA